MRSKYGLQSILQQLVHLRHLSTDTQINRAIPNLHDQPSPNIRLYLSLSAHAPLLSLKTRPGTHPSHDLQFLPAPHKPTLPHRRLQLPHHLPVERRRARHHHLHLAARRAHQLPELLAHAGQHPQPVVLAERLQEVLERGLAVAAYAGGLDEFADQSGFVAVGEGRGGEDLRELGVAVDGVVEGREGGGGGIEGAGLGCGGVLRLLLDSEIVRRIVQRGRTRALAYVPSTPKRAMGGFVSAGVA